VLKFFLWPALGLAFEIWRWRRQDIPHRAIYCALLTMVAAVSLIWWETSRVREPRHHHRHHRHRH